VFISNHKSTKVSICNLETQLGQLERKKLDQYKFHGR